MCRILFNFGIVLTWCGCVNAQLLTNLYDFSGSPDGSFPSGELISYENRLYGFTRDGGTANNGALFRISTNGGDLSVFKSFSSAQPDSSETLTNADGLHPSGIVLSSNGAVFGATELGGVFGGGVIFRTDTNNAAFSVLKAFPASTTQASNAEGSNPSAAPTLSDGTLFGTTSSGGNGGSGTIFRVGTNGTAFQVLKHFPSTAIDPESIVFTNAEGAFPRSTLLLAGDSLFGTAESGGRFGSGTLFKIGTDGGDFTVLKSFSVVSNLANWDGEKPSGVLCRAGEFLYGTASLGGTNGNGTIFKINTNGTGFEVLRTFSALIGSTNIDGAFPAWGVTCQDDTLYGTTQSGGAMGGGTLFAIRTNGSDFRVLHNFPSPQPNPTRLVLIANDLYGTVQSDGSAGNGAIFRFTVPSPADTGALRVTLSPAGVIPAGAGWRLDNGPLQTNDALLENIPYGNHLLRFSPVPGWITPADKIVIITSGITNNETGIYEPTGSGAIKVTLLPTSAVTAGAMWRVDGQSFQASDAVVTGLSSGTHQVTFQDVPGWISPAPQDVSISAGNTNFVTATYSAITNVLVLEIQPTNGAFKISLTGAIPQRPVSTYTSTNLTTWNFLRTDIPTNQTLQYFDSPGQESVRFYRAQQQ